MNLVAFPIVDAFDGTALQTPWMAELVRLNATSPATVITVADASDFLPTQPLNLTELPFDAVVFDSEKMFGFPKLGVLVMSTRLLGVLRKPYFGGGTLVYALTTRDREKMRLRPSERFEDGSLPFLNLAAVENGMRLIDSLGRAHVASSARAHVRTMVKALRSLKNADGSKAARVYGANRTTMVAFNFVHANGTVRDHRPYLASALRNNITIGGGCGGTPGTCFAALEVDEAELSRGTDRVDVSRYGALRASVGWATTSDEVYRFTAWASLAVGQ